MTRARLLALCVLTMGGFAANSLLARGAIGGGAIDPAGYSLVRLAAGAAMLAVLARATGVPILGGTWRGAAALATYAAAFSFAYVRIGAALGALIIFPVVHLALLARGALLGERHRLVEWLGAGVALAGLVALTAPRATSRDGIGILLMIVAGLAWAVYTWTGRGVASALSATSGHFARGVVVAAPLVWLAVPATATTQGLALAICSGAITSALAYAIWYEVVPHLSSMQAGLVQLSVPALAALGAVIVLGEPLTLQVAASAAVIFAGLGLAIVRR